MKKRLAAVIMALAVTFGMRIPAFAYCSTACPVSASDLSGPVATPGFNFETNMDYDMIYKFWDVSTDQQRELEAYYGYDDLATSPYATGTLHLSGTSASESNPVTVTFSLSATDEWNLPMADERIYVMQQFSDGSCKIIPAEFISRTSVSASFTDAVDSKILIISLDLAREGLIYDYVEDAKDISGVQSAVDKDNNPVTVTVSPLDWDRKAIAGEQAGFPYGEDVLAFADVNLQGATASEANPITVTFLVEGVQAGHDVSVIHKKADGTWETLTGTAGDGTVTATFTSFSPIAIVNNSLKQTRPSNSGNSGSTDNSGNTDSSGNSGNNSSTGNTGNSSNTNGNTNSTGSTGSNGSTDSSTSSGNTNTSNTASAASASALPKTGDDGAFSFVILAIASASACAAAVYSIQRKRNFFTKR